MLESRRKVNQPHNNWPHSLLWFVAASENSIVVNASRSEPDETWISLMMWSYMYDILVYGGPDSEELSLNPDDEEREIAVPRASSHSSIKAHCT
jgi:hypothetical protein